MALWDDDRIEVRDKASQELVKMGCMTKPLLLATGEDRTDSCSCGTRPRIKRKRR
jgi:hypothetical protein